MNSEEDVLRRFLKTGVFKGSTTARATVALALERYDLLPASWRDDPLRIYIEWLDRGQQIFVANHRGWPKDIAVPPGRFYDREG